MAVPYAPCALLDFICATIVHRGEKTASIACYRHLQVISRPNFVEKCLRS